MKNIRNLIREVEPCCEDFSLYFDDAGLTEAGGDYNYNLFIVPQSRNRKGFNEGEYKNIRNEIENLLELYVDIESKSNYYAQYPSAGSMFLDYELIDNIHNTKRIKDFTKFFAECCENPKSPYVNYHDNFTAHNEEMTAKYLTLKTGKEWDVDDAYGYSQGDYVKMVYCKEHYKNGTKYYGEIWLGAGKEFCVIDLNESGEEGSAHYGYIVADCQACRDEDYKKLICEWACIKEEETQLEMIDGSCTYTKYSYRTA